MSTDLVLYPWPTPPQKGDFGLTRGDSWAMTVTRFGTLSRYGHACVAVSDPWDEPNSDQLLIRNDQKLIRIVEAMPTGARVRVVRLDAFRWSNVILVQEQREVITGRALSCVGIPYDWPAILGFVAKVLGLKLHLLKSRDHPDAKMICSELVVWAYLAAGIDLGQGLAPGDVSPGDLAEYLVSH